MSLEGSHTGLLDTLHASGCDGTEYSACRPVINPQLLADPDPEATPFWVIRMEWCSECGAADWDFVGR